MKHLARTTVLSLIVIAFAGAASGQTVDASSSTPFGRPLEDPPQPVLEQLAKKRIEYEKREFQELVEDASELVQASKELLDAPEDSPALTVGAKRALIKIERLAKDIRSALGASDDAEPSGEKLADFKDALRLLARKAAELKVEIEKSSRHSVSVGAVERVNAVLNLAACIKRSN